jgi:hypothetical protein
MPGEVFEDPPDGYCAMCYCEAGSCICEECPVCGSAGDPDCYKNHGMVETEEQIWSRVLHDPNAEIWEFGE